MPLTRVYAVAAGPADPVSVTLVFQPDRNVWQVRPLYHDPTLRPLGRLDCLTVANDHPDSLLDACLAFHPVAFARCPTLDSVRSALGRAEEIDLHKSPPPGWEALRAEGRAVFGALALRRADMPFAA